MTQPVLDIEAIMRRLPHRPPFLMLDRVLVYGGAEVVALKNVSMNEGFFSGHYPGEPIMPGVLIGECMAQSAAFLGSGDEPASEGGEEAGDRGGATIALGKALLSSMTLKLEKPVVPGDQLVLTARRMKRLGRVMRVSATAAVAGQRVASAEFTVVLAFRRSA